MMVSYTDPYKNLFKTPKFIDWAQYHGRYGRDEVNSPHYLDRSLLPLLNLYDFVEDPKLKLWAQMAIDKMVSDFALLSLKNVRGGPWCRAHHNHAPFVYEHNDGRHNTFFSAIQYVFKLVLHDDPVLIIRFQF